MLQGVEGTVGCGLDGGGSDVRGSVCIGSHDIGLPTSSSTICAMFLLGILHHPSLGGGVHQEVFYSIL